MAKKNPRLRNRGFFRAFCRVTLTTGLNQSLSSHLQMKCTATPAATVIINVLNNLLTSSKMDLAMARGDFTKKFSIKQE